MDAFTFERKSPIAFFTLNRPEKYNAITPGLMREMESSMMEFMEDKSLRVGIITGAGNKAFCSGAKSHLGIRDGQLIVFYRRELLHLSWLLYASGAHGATQIGRASCRERV